MKKLFLLTLFLNFFAIYSQAQISHDLEIYSEDGLNFTLIVNGKIINETPQSNVKITNIENDYVQIVIKFEDGKIASIKRKNVQIAAPGSGGNYPVSTVYKIIFKRGVYKLRFVSRSEKKIQNKY